MAAQLNKKIQSDTITAAQASRGVLGGSGKQIRRLFDPAAGSATLRATWC